MRADSGDGANQNQELENRTIRTDAVGIERESMAEGRGWIYMGLRERSGFGALKEAALSVD